MKRSWLFLSVLLLLILLGACATPTPVPPTPVPPSPTPPPPPPSPTSPPAPPPVAPTATAAVAAPTAAPAEPTATAAPSAAEVPEVPIGNERRARDWDEDVAYLLFSRRTTASELVGGLGGIAYDPADCLRCHENAADVEGQIFYGPEFKDFAKNQWADMLSNPEGDVPIRDYDFVEAHQKRVELLLNVFPEQQIKQNP